MKLNMGCGNRRIEGYVNVDKYDNAGVDMVVDLETIPWPWESNSVSEVMFIHSLEHMGQDTQVFLNIISEVYRICAHGATVVIHVPHPRHDFFIGDPTHVRPITPQQMQLFDRKLNDYWKETQSSAATPLAHYTGVDFSIMESVVQLDSLYQEKLAKGILSIERITELSRELNNVISEYHIKLMVRKAWSE